MFTCYTYKFERYIFWLIYPVTLFSSLPNKLTVQFYFLLVSSHELWTVSLWGHDVANIENQEDTTSDCPSSFIPRLNNVLADSVAK